MDETQQTAINKLIADEKELTRQGVVLDFVKTKVDNLDKKFDTFLDKIDGKYVTTGEFKAVTADHESRIRTNERFKWQLSGGLVVFQIVADYILYVMLKK